MGAHSREKKVLLILGISITLGAAILNALGHNPPSAGAFCLSRYYLLDPVEKVIYSRADQYQQSWSQIEIRYSYTESGNIEQLAAVNNLENHENINYHFIICNGNGGHDGLIQPTENWQKQSPIMTQSMKDRLFLAGQLRNDEIFSADKITEQTIYICVIADNKTSLPTNFQVKRTEELVEELCRKFNIQPESIRYPDSWR
ncbi:MAG: N-acetylmuramoyl-L-alanine amidase [Sedimentisphaerales bacterium]|nr:N-acetylmuramoyl-L-alanine amidase [Sedimentisphaerales bacterium]